MTAINLTRLRQLRAKMVYDGFTELLIEEAVSADNARGIVATHAAADTLIEIAEAALAWKEAREASIGDAYLRCPAGPSKESQQQFRDASAAILAALAKVSKE